METLTYARARLWTGIAGVGTFVVLAAALLVLRVPATALQGLGGTFASDALTLFAALWIAAALALPFDVLGGLVLPRRFGRPSPGAGRFLSGWARGVAVLAALSSVSGALLLAAGRLGGRPAALAVFVAFALLMLGFQEPLARLVGGLRRVRREAGDDARVIVLEGDDPGFSGGFTGPSATPVIPAEWTRVLEPHALELLLERRRRIASSGAWRRTRILAVAWNALGFLLATLLPDAGIASLAELVTTVLGFTLWTFVGLLLLPTPSRRATSAADARIAQDDESRSRLARTIRTLDRLQDDEPERSPGLESVFHPVPSVASRLRALAAPGSPGADAWHLARTALFLSHAGLSLLPRAVHCNAGRPELWVYMPSDG